MIKALWIIFSCVAIISMGFIRVTCQIIGAFCAKIDNKINEVFEKWI